MKDEKQSCRIVANNLRLVAETLDYLPDDVQSHLYGSDDFDHPNKSDLFKLADAIAELSETLY